MRKEPLLSTHSSRFLHQALLFDAALTGTTALAALVIPDTLAELFSLPAGLLRAVGWGLVPFVAFVLYAATRTPIDRRAVWGVITFNALWVLASLALLLSSAVAPNAFGVAFIIVQAAAVALFAELQYIGLRRLSNSPV